MIELKIKELRDKGSEVIHSFEKNCGQMYEDAKYILKMNSYVLFFERNKVVIGIKGKECWKEESTKQNQQLRCGEEDAETAMHHMYYMELQFVGINPGVEITACDKLSGKYHYFTFRNLQRGIRDVPVYAKIRYVNIYDNIDLVFYLNQNTLEYDYIVRPYGNVSDIRVRVFGHHSLKLNETGDVKIQVQSSALMIRKPSAYQIKYGAVKKIASAFQIKNDDVMLSVERYDQRMQLVIDPMMEVEDREGIEEVVLNNER
ncbi:MAG: hypothetical protein E7256_11955 [Lachnospiraceae bacterium]|nr:hypothetical protein [Lachnospiraceae bacterium]